MRHSKKSRGGVSGERRDALCAGSKLPEASKKNAGGGYQVKRSNEGDIK